MPVMYSHHVNKLLNQRWNNVCCQVVSVYAVGIGKNLDHPLDYIYTRCCYNMSRLTTKPTKWHVRTAKTQISLGIRPVWSESSLSAWRKLGTLATQWAHREDSDQTVRMPRLIWVFAGRSHFGAFVMKRLILIEPGDSTTYKNDLSVQRRLISVCSRHEASNGVPNEASDQSAWSVSSRHEEASQGVPTEDSDRFCNFCYASVQTFSCSLPKLIGCQINSSSSRFIARQCFPNNN